MALGLIMVLAEIRMLAENLEEERVPDAYLNLMHVAPVFAHGLRDGTGSGFDLPITVRHDGARRVSCNDQLLAALLHKR